MTKYQKIFITVSLVLVIPMALIMMRSLLGGIRFNGSLLGLIVLILVHWLLYYFFRISYPLRKWIIYIPSIFFFLITLLFAYIAIRNYQVQCELTDAGCMNEDFSIVFLIIAGTITITSFCYSLLFQYLWFKKERIQDN